MSDTTELVARIREPLVALEAQFGGLGMAVRDLVVGMRVALDRYDADERTVVWPRPRDDPGEEPAEPWARRAERQADDE